MNPDDVLGDHLDRDLVAGEPIMDQGELPSFPGDEQVPGALVCVSSGTTGSPKRVPYARDLLTRRSRKAMRLMGVEEGDSLLSLAAPSPHSSGVYIENLERAGIVETCNSSFKDFREVVGSGDAADATVLMGAPMPSLAMAEQLEADGIPVQDAFPGLRLGVFSGDIMTGQRRSAISDAWGLEETRSFYASTEFESAAVAVDETPRLVPLLDEFIFEIVPDGGEEPVDIRAVDEEVSGSLILSDPFREHITLRRYRTRDRIKVFPGPPLPRIEILGREDDTISLGGAPLYRKQIALALEDVFGGRLEDWRCHVYEVDGRPAVDVYAVSDLDVGGAEFRSALFDRAPPVKEAVEDVPGDLLEHLRLRTAPSLHHVYEEIGLEEPEGFKADRIIFDR